VVVTPHGLEAMTRNQFEPSRRFAFKDSRVSNDRNRFEHARDSLSKDSQVVSTWGRGAKDVNE
jgi:hypothetical protein